MRITILHNAVADSDSAADRDVLVQVAAVEEALVSLGHAVRRLPCTLNLELIEEALSKDRPDLVFNLVETLAGSDRLAHLAAVLLDDLDLTYTGTGAWGLHLTSNKPRAKERLRAAGLPTPAWTVVNDRERASLEPPYIIKAIWEHASVGIDDHAVIQTGDGSLVGEQIASRSRQLGQPCFAEQFIDGREFNLSLIAAGSSPRVLPPAEIDFSAFPRGKPRIVGYAAKWDERAMEYAHTPRKFEFPVTDAPLLDWLRSLAVECWRLFDLAGYARVDFRVDSRGQPWILEINANPCLAPDAGFAAALGKGGLPFVRAIEWIVAEALLPRERSQEPGVGSQESGDGGQQPVASGQEPVARDRNPNASFSPPRPLAPSPTHDSPLTNYKAPKTRAQGPRQTTITLRTQVLPEDCDAVRQIVAAAGLFRVGEIDVAVELVEARLQRGAASGYEFIFAEREGETIGYICFGKNTVTVSSFEVYWIAVEPSQHGQGIGRLLLEEAQSHIAAAGGTRIYVETSHRSDYQATRAFYERCGYELVSLLDDFYAPGDGKATYLKILQQP